MPNPSVLAAAEGVPSFLDLGPLICDLRNMTAIADRVYDEYLSHALALKFIDRNEADELSYASKHVFQLATDLRAAFYEAVKNKAGLVDPATPMICEASQFHARELAKAMAAWPEEMRFQITIVPHDAEQALFWHLMPTPALEVGQLSECINTYKAALKAFAAVCDADDETSLMASENEEKALTDMLTFLCRTSQAKALKAEYIISLLRQPFHPKLDSDQLERLLDSLIQ